MDDLDKKLDKALMYFEISEIGVPAMDDVRTTQERLKDRVKQAFIDAGWMPSLDIVKIPVKEVSIDNLKKDHEYNECMTGQEWYDRFEKELLAYFDEDGDFPKYLDGYKTNEIRGVAKKAAGIE